ncbi:tungsten ABC transporter substrate-binding protein [Anaerobacillus alkaliphilus]|uniref:Tungsten ABC transporter substrate-binding protein n=1 Tax=Anaerobacillus alkaliphilus TaxID=1548597 RepID=A0A4Q0VNU2_9BACI|nr:substrate-binding domain-containing protein [Anaerobacillus alkaliphilus]RXI96696.1 tungsten ABC transporter substrate-binding protein [Anaerobacillus alkaliphilus]
MKSNSKLILSLFALLMFVMVACSNNAEPAKETEVANEVTETTETEAPQTEAQEMILATTTSTQDSGLLDVLIPLFEEKHNIKVKTIAVGTGQALAMGEKGEADALLTHAPASELKLVESQDVVKRKRVMYNDFVIVGPEVDPAGIKGADAKTAFANIFNSGATFVSRGDDSGTHKMELNLWAAAELNPTGLDWYLETGQGMGNTLQLSAEKDGYVLTDRATYLAHAKNFEHMVILVEGDDVLLNIYHVMQVNDEKHSLVNGEAGNLFVEFMVSAEVQEIIKDFGVEQYGQPLFFQYTE